MIELWTTITIECAHTNRALGEFALHGHSYWVQFFVRSNPTDPVPLALLKEDAALIKRALDHTNLDEALLEGATMESLALLCAHRWSGLPLTRIVVRRDSLGCGVEWRP